ncbi:SGNH/GDSL hydrolase family protein [Arthrobacter bambusae]|uniref:SGNH/GDSL hydrolase family protein n=1 Tax=Arthrobacter bambusae TaxID=1338426 RepID=UPI00277E76AF|nr:SGNH/GDSL hydrolase family protein [Arthrobacter bambusae]MDQ0031803.1 acyl-CoA thioesterase-1 [Arthrobacter bambusae]MDQ0099919.1 acyl-CoA thioesterase-1 [Arthrobacter bambusae]
MDKSRIFRFAASVIAVGVLLAGCSQAPSVQPSSDGQTAAPAAPSGSPAAAAQAPKKTDSGQDPSKLPVGSLYKNPANNRKEIILADVRHTAVLIGDSQSQPEGSWPRAALGSIGYKVYTVGRGGTGFVAATSDTGNYIDALQRGDWVLPYGAPPLVVVQGGGNDAARKVSDEQITSNANRLIAALRKRYPLAKIAMIGTLAKGSNAGGGRRTEVDALLGNIAAKAGATFFSVGDWITKYQVAGDLVDGVHLNAAGHAKLGGVLGADMAAAGLRLPPDRAS